MGPIFEYAAAPPTCHAHPGAPAVATCFDCLKELCSVCTAVDSAQSRCLSCARAHQSRQRWQAAATALLGLAAISVLGGGAGWMWWRYEPPFDYGDFADDIARLDTQLQDEPCDRQKILGLTELLVQSGDNRGAIERSESFFTDCGKFTRLRWLTYEGHKRLSEWDKAAGEVTHIIDDNPWDADFRWWRGFVYEEKGDFTRAIEDYQQAIALRPQIPSIPLNLASLLEKQDRPCEALSAIEQMLFYYPHVDNVGELRHRADALSRAGDCRKPSEGKARIRFDRRGEAILTRARINGRAEGTFVVDTGASYVTLGQAFAEKLGVSLDGPRVLLATASGQHQGVLAMLDEIDVQGVKATAVPIVVIDGLDPALDGLLGLSYLARFDLVTKAGELEIRPRGGS